ncbi:MAG TPA: GerMN domain-containing protein [Acidobacteriota bacterium]|nr:GerMN domain-containing protein [Acidobacteriota bacterium]
MNRPIVIGILLFLISLGALLFVLKRPTPQQASQNQAPASQSASHPSTETAPTERRINAILFFNEKDSTLLATENHFVPYRETLRDQAFEVMKEMVKGPNSELASTLPDGTQVRELFITHDGTAYVDFSAELAANHVGGSLAEINTVYAIVNTLTLNFPKIKRVQILVDDHAVDTLTGHLDLSRPLRQDLSMVRTHSEQPPAAPATETSPTT